eukprot:1153298-Pelagomonas_calceolata.AAC.1
MTQHCCCCCCCCCAILIAYQLTCAESSVGGFEGLCGHARALLQARHPPQMRHDPKPPAGVYNAHAFKQQVPIILIRPSGTCYSCHASRSTCIHLHWVLSLFYRYHFLTLSFCPSPRLFNFLNGGQNGRCTKRARCPSYYDPKT